MSDVPAPFELASGAAMVLVLLVDLLLAQRRPRVPSTRESAMWVGVYVLLAVAFGGVLALIGGPDDAVQFAAGWLTEYSLSIDNLFVFLVLMSGFAVPKRSQQQVLLIGIVVALVLRGIFIVIGAQLIESFSWVFYLFGAFLVVTAVRQAFGGESAPATDSRVARLLRRRLPFTEVYDGAKLRTTVDGRRMWTPVLIVLFALGGADLLFALDSIPAIFGITQDPFIVFSANVFALMGLRQLYFLLGDLVERLKYLKYGIAFILAFIGVKLVLHALHENSLVFLNRGRPIDVVPEIGTGISLAVIVAAMAVATGVSLIALRREPAGGR